MKGVSPFLLVSSLSLLVISNVINVPLHNGIFIHAQNNENNTIAREEEIPGALFATN